MSNADVIKEVLLRFTEPYLAIGETNYDNEAYNNLLAICFIHDYCYDLIRENAELKGNEYSIVEARETAIKHLSESLVCMRDLLDELKAESEEEQKAVNELEKSNHIQTLNTVKDWLEQPLCGDYISREKALEIMCDTCPMYNCLMKCSSYTHIEKMPSVTPQPKRGKWIEKIGEGFDAWAECSECGCVNPFEDDFNYCPNCGADMREVTADE